MRERTPTKKQLHAQLRRRISAAIPEGSGAEIRNLCDALFILEGRGKNDPEEHQKLTVSFDGDAEDYSL